MSDKRFRILLVSPISEYKDYVLPTWLRYIKSLQRSYNSGHIQLDVLLCDNSQNAQYYKQLSREFKVRVMHVNPFGKNSRQFICESRNALTDYFLSHDYNYMLSLECDIFPHPHFLAELIAHKKKLVSFPYFIGAGAQSSPMLNMVDTAHDSPCDSRNISIEEMFLMAGKVLPVFNPGLGCALIHRSIIERFEFRWNEEILYHDDSFFAEDIYKAGLDWYCDFNHFLRHLNEPWNYFPEAKF